MISILIPIYNGIEFMQESVSSVINQTYTEWELLIGINGHAKKSDIYKKVKKFKKLQTPEIKRKIRIFDFYNIKGKPNTLNNLIQYCVYDYVALLDVDDIWENTKLEIQVPLILSDYDVVGSNCIYFGTKNIVPKLPTRDITYFNFFKKNPIINSSCIIRKELCNWIPEEYMEDYDLWLRLRKLGKRFYNCPQVLVKHRIHENSHFNSTGNHRLLRDQMLKRHLQ